MITDNKELMDAHSDTTAEDHRRHSRRLIEQELTEKTKLEASMRFREKLKSGIALWVSIGILSLILGFLGSVIGRWVQI